MGNNLELRDPEFIRLDLFPATVSDISEGKTDTFDEEVRVIVTDDYFYVFHEGETGPEVLIEGFLSDFTGSNKEGYTVSTELEQFFIKRATSCGCGSRLRSFMPFPGTRIIKSR